MDSLTKSSVAALLVRIMNLASRPLTEFNKYEALELLNSLKNAAHDAKHEKEQYYRLAYETMRGKLDRSDQQFREFLMLLLGDKDHEKVLDVVSKVEKRHARASQRSTAPPSARRRLPPNTTLRCFYCGTPGHFQAQCRKWKRETEEQQRAGDLPSLPDPRLQRRT